MKGGGAGRAGDLALLLPVLGTLALVPPFVGLFARSDLAMAGIPLIVVYLFGLWLVLILAAMLLSRHLRRGGDGTEDPGEGGDG